MAIQIVIDPAVIIKLKDIGVTYIESEYNGSGDSGQIDSIIYWTKGDGEQIKDIPNELHQVIENSFYKSLEDTMDWYNNEGGYGVIMFDLNDMTFKIDQHIRITNTEYYDFDVEIKPE